ncbi:hypothetical protein FQR65_LT13291 [Abscondita terminalis]|nr:hypothetical protein FQR65_LT13291 [Abscondita terminalis]
MQLRRHMLSLPVNEWEPFLREYSWLTINGRLDRTKILNKPKFYTRIRYYGTVNEILRYDLNTQLSIDYAGEVTLPHVYIQVLAEYFGNYDLDVNCIVWFDLRRFIELAVLATAGSFEYTLLPNSNP